MKYFRGFVSAPQDSLGLRFFKISVLKKPRAEGAQFQEDPLAAEAYTVPGSIPIVPGSIGVRLGPIGECIYCGETEFAPGVTRLLSEEHIVSGALGGNIKLLEASCERCAGYTSGVESFVFNDLFWAARHRLRLRAGTQKHGRKEFKFSMVVDGEQVVLKVPLRAHPTMLLMPMMLAPGIITSRKIGSPGLCGLWNHWLHDPGDIDADEVMTPALDTLRFCQFIAKTGHAFASAAVGLDTFVPALPDFILRKFGRTEAYSQCYHLIGGHAKRYPVGKHLHELGLGFTKRSDDWLLSVHIRFFANLGAPVYVAVVGKLKPALTPKEVLARSTLPRILHRHTPDKNRADPR